MERSNIIVLSLVAVVAVVGLVTMFLQGGTGTVSAGDVFADEQGNVVGEAIKRGNRFQIPRERLVKACPKCPYSSKPIYVRLYERGGEDDPGTANRIVLEHPFGAGWDNLIQLNRIADADQEPPVTSVGLDLQKESGYEYLVLALNENRDVDFGRIMVNIELTQINEADGYIVVKLIRK